MLKRPSGTAGAISRRSCSRFCAGDQIDIGLPLVIAALRAQLSRRGPWPETAASKKKCFRGDAPQDVTLSGESVSDPKS